MLLLWRALNSLHLNQDRISRTVKYTWIRRRRTARGQSQAERTLARFSSVQVCSVRVYFGIVIDYVTYVLVSQLCKILLDIAMAI